MPRAGSIFQIECQGNLNGMGRRFRVEFIWRSIGNSLKRFQRKLGCFLWMFHASFGAINNATPWNIHGQFFIFHKELLAFSFSLFYVVFLFSFLFSFFFFSRVLLFLVRWKFPANRRALLCESQRSILVAIERSIALPLALALAPLNPQQQKTIDLFFYVQQSPPPCRSSKRRIQLNF